MKKYNPHLFIIFKLLILFIPFILISCRENVENIKKEFTHAQLPIYTDQLNQDTISYEVLHTARFPDKYIDTLDIRFELDKFYGIHLYDISDTNNIRPLGFYAINGCSRINVTDGLLCTNFFSDSMSVDFTVLNTPRIVKYLPDTHKDIFRGLPPEQGPFDCVEPDSGYVIGWIWKYKPEALCLN